MKKLPASWSKSKPKQLSFADALFGKPSEEDLFIQNFLIAMRNLKFLRYRVQHSKAKTQEKLSVYTDLSNALEAACTLLSKVSVKSTNNRHKTVDDYMHDIFIEKIDWPTGNEHTMSELRSHHDNVSAKITGMFLAYNPILKKVKREVAIITELMKSSHITLYRLNVI